MSVSDADDLLDGIVRINSGVYGRPYNPTVFRHPQKQPLLAGASVDGNGHFSHVKIKQVPDDYLIHDRITNAGKHDFIDRHVSPESNIIHAVILDCSPDRFRPLIQLCQQAGNWINYTFNGIGPKHLQSYLDQYCFGMNNRENSSSLFHRLLHWSVSSSAVTYPVLIGRADHSAHHKRTYFKLLKEAC